jgi:hypothetical protein
MGSRRGRWRHGRADGGSPFGVAHQLGRATTKPALRSAERRPLDQDRRRMNTKNNEQPRPSLPEWGQPRITGSWTMRGGRQGRAQAAGGLLDGQEGVAGDGRPRSWAGRPARWWGIGWGRNGQGRAVPGSGAVQGRASDQPRSRSAVPRVSRVQSRPRFKGQRASKVSRAEVRNAEISGIAACPRAASSAGDGSPVGGAPPSPAARRRSLEGVVEAGGRVTTR